jgi:hypothetical protein
VRSPQIIREKRRTPRKKLELRNSKLRLARQNAAIAAGKISLVEICCGFLPADYWSNRHIPAGNLVVGPQETHLCTSLGEIHKFT